jgi:hypothetical protein
VSTRRIDNIQRFHLGLRKGSARGADVARHSSPGRRLLHCVTRFNGSEDQMIDRRHAIRLVLAALPAAWLPKGARAQQSFQRFVPFLVELPGWKGNKPDGMAMEVAGASMITASRAYERGDARLNASILTGTAAQAALAATSAGVKIETADMHIVTSTVDGMQVTKTYTGGSKSGAIMVGLGPSAVFTLTFSGVPEDEALGLAQKFDWKAMQAQVK